MRLATVACRTVLASLSLLPLIGQAWLVGGCGSDARLELPTFADTLELSSVGDDAEPVRLVGPVWYSDLLAALSGLRAGRQEKPPGGAGGPGENPGPALIRCAISANGQEPAELVLGPDRVWAQGRVWTGEGVAAAYALCRAPVTLRAEVAQKVAASTRVVVFMAVPGGTRAELGPEAASELAGYLADSSLTSEGPLGSFFPEWPRPVIEVYADGGRLVLTIVCRDPGTSELNRAGEPRLWSTEPFRRTTIWEWAVSVLPPAILDPSKPESLMLASGVTVNRQNETTVALSSGYAVGLGSLLSTGADAGRRPAPEAPPLILTFKGVAEGREQVLVLSDGFWWAGRWYALAGVGEAVNSIMSLP